MKKALLIGCGSLLLIILSIGGFLFWVYYGPMTGLLKQIEESAPQFVALDETYAFDATGDTTGAPGSGPSRFEQHLLLRVELNQLMASMGEEIQSVSNDEELPTWKKLRAAPEALTNFVPQTLGLFVEHKMGPSEFRYHSRLLWAAMRELDKGNGPANLSDMRDRYSLLRNTYEDSPAHSDDAPDLEDVIGHESVWPVASIDRALDALAIDLERAHSALFQLEFEPLTMQLDFTDAEAISTLVMPTPTGGSPALEGR